MLSESRNNRIEQRKKIADERLALSQAKAESDRILLEKIDRCIGAMESRNFKPGIIPSEPSIEACLTDNEQAKVKQKLMDLIDKL